MKLSIKVVLDDSYQLQKKIKWWRH